MPDFAQGCRVSAGNRLVAVGTARAEAIVVAGCVIGSSVVFVEALITQWLPAGSTAEATRMPCAIQGCDVRTGEWLTAAGARQVIFLQDFLLVPEQETYSVRLRRFQRLRHRITPLLRHCSNTF